MKLNKILKILLVLCLLFFLIKAGRYAFERFVYPNMAHNAVSEYRDDAFNSRYKFKVTRKYMDSLNHNNNTIIGIDSNNVEQKIEGALEFEGLYNLVGIGDTIVKNSKSYDFLIRNKTQKIFHYTFNGR